MGHFAKSSGKTRCWVKCGGLGRWQTVTGTQGWRILARRLVGSRKGLSYACLKLGKGRVILTKADLVIGWASLW